jgi:putative sterol carrier protein
MVRFPSQEWANQFRVALNANRDYADAASAWEGDIFLLVNPEGSIASPGGVHLDLYHGTCRAATFHADPARVSSEFVYAGAPADWARLLRGEIDPVQAILRGTFKIRGNLAKAMRFPRAATLLAQVAASIPADT